MCRVFLVPFGRRHSLLGSSAPHWGLGPSLRSAYRACARTPSGFHVPHVRVATGEGALSTPRTVVLTRPDASFRPPPAASQRQRPCTSVMLPPPEAQLDEASSRVHRIRPSGLPLACGPRMERGPLGLARSFAPRRYQRRTSGWGQALSTGQGLRSRRHRSTLLSTSPLVSCDLVSHLARVAAPVTAPRGRCPRSVGWRVL